MAAAQPTPEDTRIAPAGQFLAQAPHSMQAPGSLARAFPPSTARTAWGQTSTHSPQPEQAASSIARLSSFLMYLMARIAASLSEPE
jgi:hypothetical protein